MKVLVERMLPRARGSAVDGDHGRTTRRRERNRESRAVCVDRELLHPPTLRARRQRTSALCCVELEDGSALGRTDRIVEIDAVDGADEPDTAADAPRQSSEIIPKEADALLRVQLGGANLLGPAAFRDRCLARCSEVTNPVDLAPGSPDPPPALDLDDRDGIGARHAALSASNRDEPIGAQRDAG